MKPNGNGTWSESVIHNFSGNDPAGIAPRSSIIFDRQGNLYGTTYAYGSRRCGAAFEMAPASPGRWNILALYDFGCGSDGGYLPVGVVMDNMGRLFGTTQHGGTSNDGVVYELDHVSTLNWHERVLHSFGSGPSDGTYANGLIFDNHGNLYGTAQAAGTYNSGMVYKLTPSGRGNWSQTIIYSFTGGADGAGPMGDLVFDAAGNLYSTTFFGGCAGGYGGVAFKLIPQLNGTWSETVIHSFVCSQGDAGNPDSTLIFDRAGNLYGEALLVYYEAALFLSSHLPATASGARALSITSPAA